MAVEIERKFLVANDSWREKATKKTLFKQAYLNSTPERTVRVRIAGDAAFLTIKGKNQGLSRAEFEYAIPVTEAESLLALCETPALEKYRYLVQHEAHLWEIDEFFGVNQGLVLAEIELASENESFAVPQWLGEEVSRDKRYFNSALSINPYCSW